MKTPTEDTPVSERKWTKGDFRMFHSDDGHPWIADKSLNNVCWVRREDHASLITAAPDLYEALDQLLFLVDPMGVNHSHTYDKARTALQRAEGEET